jgi:acetolactate synthase-1/2/3 large subunit
VWAIDGDGCFQMTNQELATCAIKGIPIKVAIINNEPRHGAPVADAVLQRALLQHRPAHLKRIPDFVKLAEAYGCVGLSLRIAEDVDATIAKAMEINDVPVVIDFHRAPRRHGVADGRRRHSNDDIKYARDLRARVRRRPDGSVMSRGARPKET